MDIDLGTEKLLSASQHYSSSNMPLKSGPYRAKNNQSVSRNRGRNHDMRGYDAPNYLRTTIAS